MSEQVKQLIQKIIEEYKTSDQKVNILSQDLSNIVEHRRVTLYINKDQFEVIKKEFDDIVWE